MSHLKTKHLTYKEDYDAAMRDGHLDTLETHSFVSEPAKNLFGWIDLIATKNLPFAFVDDPKVRKYANLKPTTSKTLKKTMLSLERRVEDKIMAILPNDEPLVLILDGWSNGGTH